MSTTSTSSLFDGSVPVAAAADAHEFSTYARTLLDLLYDGFFMLFQLRNSQQPTSAKDLLSRVHVFLDGFDHGAKRLSMSAEDVFDAKYAPCAAVDETVLPSNFTVRPVWERHPLQLVLSDEQLVGETFFIKLGELRAYGAPRLQALEVLRVCLPLGFRGKCIPEGSRKLAYLTARLSDGIPIVKGKRAAFIPHWPLPDKAAYMLKRETPLWIFDAVFTLIRLLGLLGLSHTLNVKANETLEGYSQVIKLGSCSSHLTTPLP